MTSADGIRLLQVFFDIEVPVISAINGPVVTHSATPLLADLVLATPDTVVQDATPFIYLGCLVLDDRLDHDLAVSHRVEIAGH